MENKYITAYKELERLLPSDEEISKIAEEFCCSEDDVQDELVEKVKDDPEYILWKGIRQNDTRYSCNAFFSELIDVLFNNLELLEGPHSEMLASFYTTVADALGFMIVQTPEYAKHRALTDLLFNAAEMAETRGAIADACLFLRKKREGTLDPYIECGRI